MILNADWWCTNFASFENHNQPCNQSMPYCTAIPRVVDWTFKITISIYCIHIFSSHCVYCITLLYFAVDCGIRTYLYTHFVIYSVLSPAVMTLVWTLLPIPIGIVTLVCKLSIH